MLVKSHTGLESPSIMSPSGTGPKGYEARSSCRRYPRQSSDNSVLLSSEHRPRDQSLLDLAGNYDSIVRGSSRTTVTMNLPGVPAGNNLPSDTMQRRPPAYLGDGSAGGV